DRRGLTITGLEPGVTLAVKTRRSCYRITILDGAQRVVAVDGGIFPETTVVTLSGATFGGSALKVGWIAEGLRREFCDGTRRITSSPVESVEIEGTSPTDACRERAA